MAIGVTLCLSGFVFVYLQSRTVVPKRRVRVSRPTSLHPHIPTSPATATLSEERRSLGSDVVLGSGEEGIRLRKLGAEPGP
jgi:hypothetical protein